MKEGIDMTKTIVKAPFRADHVGSLLRPDNLHKARADFKEGKISAEALREVETKKLNELLINKLKLV